MTATAPRACAMAVFAIACAGGCLATAAAESTTLSRHGLRVPMPFALTEAPDELDTLVLADSRHQYCGADSRQTVSRQGVDEPLPAITFNLTVETHPTGYHPGAAARRAVRDYRLYAAVEPYAMWPSLYLVSDAKLPPGSRLPWQCRSAVATAENEDGVGDEELACVFVDGEELVQLRASLKLEATDRRDALLAAVAAIRRSGDPVAPASSGPRKP